MVVRVQMVPGQEKLSLGSAASLQAFGTSGLVEGATSTCFLEFTLVRLTIGTLDEAGRSFDEILAPAA